MDLILWRHAEAEELPEGTADARSDLERKLTARGDKQAARMAEWLDRQHAKFLNRGQILINLNLISQ